MSNVAFTSIVTMHQAAWGDEAGSTVTFRLPMNDTGESRNPFHSFTKRRKGHSGTRFQMSVSTAQDEPQAVYLDEAMLAGWNDSQQNGHTVKFWLCNDAMGHPFEGYSRTQEMALVLVELDDDNEVIDQKMRDRVEQQGTVTSSRPSFAAAMLCKEDNFYAFINEDIEQSGDLISKKVTTENAARLWMCQRLGILSRAELDSNSDIERQFHDGIRLPYLAWIGEDRVPF
jgi:hypothetical protein